VMTRFGFLALCATMMVQYIALSFPLTPDLSRWFAASGMLAVGALLALYSYALYTASVTRRPSPAGSSS